MIEQHDPEFVLEGGRDEAPHVLIAAEAMREDHGALAVAANLHVIALKY
jgi:hypothetical protein